MMKRMTRNIIILVILFFFFFTKRTTAQCSTYDILGDNTGLTGTSQNRALSQGDTLSLISKSANGEESEIYLRILLGGTLKATLRNINDTYTAPSAGTYTIQFAADYYQDASYSATYAFCIAPAPTATATATPATPATPAPMLTASATLTYTTNASLDTLSLLAQGAGEIFNINGYLFPIFGTLMGFIILSSIFFFIKKMMRGDWE